MIRQYCYISASRTEPGEETLQAILASSRRHNEASNVTGMLTHGGGTFFQVLEGTPEAIDETMYRILADQRHHDVKQVQDEERPQRDFPVWRMAYRPLDNGSVARFRAKGFVHPSKLNTLLSGIDMTLAATFLMRIAGG